MSILTYPLGFIGGGKEDFYNNVMENSVRFDGASHMLRTPAVAGDPEQFTFSFWYKAADLGSQRVVISQYDSGTDVGSFSFESNDRVDFIHWTGSYAWQISPTQVFRDPSAWTHIVIVHDSQNGVAVDRQRIYVNGEKVTSYATQTNSSQGFDSATFNTAQRHSIGNRHDGTADNKPLEGNLTDFYFIDGYALSAENFGEFKNGAWIPKAYAGPPPILTDSSLDPKGLDLWGTNAGKLTYDQYYIGESAIDARNNAPAIRVNDRAKLSIGASEDFTIDFWVYGLGAATDHNYRIFQGGANQSDGISLLYGDSSGDDPLQFGNSDHSGGTATIQIARSNLGYGSFEWHHCTVTRNGTSLKMYADGVLANTVTDSSTYYTDPTNDNFTLFGYPGSGVTNSRPNFIIDEFRYLVGESKPPRFYFGTNYGDEDGGRLAHRATTADKFTDDERTLLLISGKSANTHARAISLIDESGFHTDNVHFSNSTVSFYPTQDGVGHHFTISGPEHTTKESFIGNTSSIVTDGADDYFTAPDHADWSFGAGSFTVDFWVYRPDTDGTGSHISIHTHGASGADVGAWGLYTASAHGVGVSDGNSGHSTPANVFFKDHTWHHVTWVRAGSSGEEIYVDGMNTAATGRSPAARDFSAGVELRIGHYWGGEYTAAYYDEIRVIKGAPDKPQIKWTHTQTAGAGNKAPYDVHAWRVHGHEFTDDNATSLLVHGDFSESANTTNLDKKGYQFDGSNDVVDLGDLHAAINYVSFAGWWYLTNHVNDAALFAKRSSTEQTGDYFVRLTTEGRVLFDAWTGSGWQGSVTSSTSLPIGRVFHFGFQYSSDGTGLCRMLLDGELIHTDSSISSPQTLNGGTSDFRICANDGQNPGWFKGACLGFTWWNHSSQANMLSNMSEAKMKGVYDLGPTGNILTSYSTDLAGWWGMGNQDSLAVGNSGGSPAAADTSTTVYDRSRVGSVTNGTFNGAAAPVVLNTITNALLDTGASTFKDSSSANSIHHALVSGGGAHHTKAVTMSSDGTNGTSTTDALGNTIYWCGSNSTVTYANSSSFSGYGNTAIWPNNGYNGTHQSIQIADHADFDVADNADFSMFCWVYINQARASQYQAILDARVSDTWTGLGHLAVDPTLDLRMHSNRGTHGGGTAQRLTAGSWHHVGFTRKTSTGYLFRDGVMVASGTDDGAITTTTPFRVGEAQHSASNSNVIEDLDGYVTEVMYTKSYMPPRFYLGNQTAESVTTTSNVKYADFNGTNTESSADRWTIANITGAKLEMWSDGQGSSPVTANTGVTWATWANPDVAANDNIVAKVGGSRMYLSSNDAEWAFGVDGGSNVHAAKNKVGSWDFVVGSWKMGVAKFYVNGLRAGGYDYTSSNMSLTDSGEDGQLSIGGSTSDELFFDGQIAQFGVWNYELSADEIMELYNLGIKGNWSVASGAYTHNTSTYMQGYYAMGNHDAVQSSAAQTGGTADTVALIQDRSGNDNDAAQATTEKQPALSSATTFYEAKAAKRLVQAVEPVTTSYVANNHYANVQPQSVLPQNFGGFVDDEYTVLLLRGGHADGNTAFYDGGVPAGETITFPAHSYSYGKSRIAKELTVQNNAHHEVTDALGLHGTSIDFDGTNDAVLTEAHGDFKFEADVPFCVECWHKKDATSGVQTLIGLRGSGTVSHYFYFIAHNSVPYFMGGNGAPRFSINGVTDIYSSSGWHHVAFQRWNDQAMIFVDGVCEGLVTKDSDVDVADVINAEGGLRIGENLTYSEDFDGRIDELRVTKGIPRYTPDGASVSGIVPKGSGNYAGVTGSSIPTSAYLRPTPFLAADGGRGYFANTNVKLWIKSDSYPGDTTFEDYTGRLYGQDAKIISNEGNTLAAKPTLQTGTGDFALSGGSDAMLFDGSNDYIEVPSHPNLHVYNGTQDFTVECWFNETAKSSGSNRNPILTIGTSTSNGLPIRAFPSYVSAYIDGGEVYGGGGGAAGLWRHVALQRHNRVKTLFVDGVAVRSTVSTASPAAAGMKLWIGRDQHSASYQEYFNGKIDELRISKMARYTGQGLIDSDYPEPGTEFGIQTEGSTYGRFDTQITANTTYQRYNYQHSESLKSYLFDGTADYITLANKTYHTATNLASGVMTYNFWVKLNGTQNDKFLFGSGQGGTTTGHYFRIMSSKFDATIDTASPRPIDALSQYGDLTDLSWHMCSFTWDGTTNANAAKIYIDGTLNRTSTAASTDTEGDPTYTPIIGKYSDGTSGGYLDGNIAQIAVWDRVLTPAQIGEVYLLGPEGNLTTSHSTDLELYYAMGNQDSLLSDGADTASNLYDRSGNNRDATGTSMAAPVSDTKLLIHSNEDIDGDTSIVDSSPSAHLIDRVVADPKYANTGANRSSLAGASYNGIFMDRSPDYLSLGLGGSDGAFDVGAASGNTEDYTIAFWWRPTAIYDNAGLWSSGTSSSGFSLALSGTSNIVLSENGSTKMDATHGFSVDTWYHIAITRSGDGTASTIVYKNGSSLGSSQCNRAFVEEDIRLNWFFSGVNYGDAYYDQFMFIKGAALTATHLGHLTGSGNANTAFGTAGGLILHEEYSDGTNTANAASTFLLHSNNATHHSQGSRKFYNDVANTRFTTTTGHEAAGRFTIGASSGIFTVLGAHQTGYSPAMNNPSIRLRRGYTYIFSASSLSSHKFYFANSSANTAGSAYGADTGQANEYITGLYGTNSTVDGTETWTAFSAGHFLGGNGTTGQWNHIKFEVPTNAPKDLYYRCSVSGHQAMGNAAFIMEATEPAPVKVAHLPALITSTWNDRDYAGIGTNNSVMHFKGGEDDDTRANYLTIADSADWDLGFNWSISWWQYMTDSGTKGNSTGIWGQYASGTNRLQCYKIGTNDQMALYMSIGGNEGFSGDYESGLFVEFNKWEKYDMVASGTSGNYTVTLYKNGVAANAGEASDANVTGISAPFKIGYFMQTNHAHFSGFMDDFQIYKGIAFNANTIIEKYQTGRAGNYTTANSSCVLYIKADSYYGNTVFTDASPSGHTITNIGGVYHHIDDNRTANTALYFDGTSYLGPLGNEAQHGQSSSRRDRTIEFWFKPMIDGSNIAMFCIGTSTSNLYLDVAWQGASTSPGPNPVHVFVGAGSGNGANFGETRPFVWNHVAVVRRKQVHYVLINGICMGSSTDYATDQAHNRGIFIGTKMYSDAVAGTKYKGFMDGIRITEGMPRYTSGIPVDGQSPDKKYDDGRSSNVSSATWATSTTREYYGINTHTYLQTTQYATDANTVLMLRGDDAETANDGVNMYGENGFHLEFKEVGSGTERDYNNFNTGVQGLGSDTSATSEFGDEGTVFMLRSRPNQANGSVMFINEVDQKVLSPAGDSHHNTGNAIFSVDSNTANVSIASGGTRNY